MPPRNLHRSETRAHARLGFHPDCPVCRRDRLSGALSPDPAFSLRVRALLATGVLALSGGLTSTSVALEPDQQQEGAVPPGTGAPSTDQGTPGDNDPATDDLGPGADEDTALTDSLPGFGTQPGGSAADPDADAGPVEAEPLDDPAYPEPDLESSPPAPAPVQPAPAPATPPVAPLVQEDAPAVSDPPPVRSRKPRGKREQAPGRHKLPRLPRTQAPPAPVPPAEPPAPPPTYAAATQAAEPVRAVSGPTYTVQHGDSLWSIAARLLGPGAGAAVIADEVRRLWTLNERRIGTGDPNLLIAGTMLELR